VRPAIAVRARGALLGLLLAAAAAGGTGAEAQTAFALTRIELVFHNGRGDITVPLRYPDLRAYATLRFTGSGVLQATWRVDGRILATVVEPTLFGETLMFASPRAPASALPTFEPGLHRVTLDVSVPRPAFRLPEITYFVTAEDWEDFKKRMEKS
jgi:hypothetical protein